MLAADCLTPPGILLPAVSNKLASVAVFSADGLIWLLLIKVKVLRVIAGSTEQK